MIDGPSYLPPTVTKGGPHFCSRCCLAGTYAKDIAIHNLPLSPPFDPLSSSLKPVIFRPKSAISQNAIDIKNDPAWLKEAVVEASKYDNPLHSIKGKLFSMASDFYVDKNLSSLKKRR
jgi:hypothetical protein